MHQFNFKYKVRYDLQSKMCWHSDFKSFTKNLFPLKLSEEKPKILDSKNEAKHN